MPRYLGLLRGVNVGGKHKLPMAELRALVEALGHTEVSTFIQSGNVIFTAARPVTPGSLETAIHDRLGIDTTVVLRTSSELERIVQANPFADRDPAVLHVGFLARRPAATTVSDLAVDRFDPEQCAIRGTECYLYLPNGMGRAKLPAYLDRRIEIPVTVRNWNTVTKLLALVKA